MLQAVDLSLQTRAGPHSSTRLSGVSLTLQPGEVHAVLGANGAGKSTLVQLLAGDYAPSSGRVLLDGRPLSEWPLRELAVRRAVLPQQETLRFGFRAREVVALGRLPHGQPSPQREADIVDSALAAAGVTHLSERLYPSLSGGERARVQFARVLAQVWTDTDSDGGTARYLLLDEPTASLDLAHQHLCLSQARAFAARGGGVLAVLHDPNQAMAFADRVSLLREGQLIASGPPSSVLTAEHLGRVYDIEVAIIEHSAAPHPLVVMTGVSPPRPDR